MLPISGFLPVPLPMMIPFMGAQSLVIGKMFGEGFQYGKRKISAMPNEEFNKLTFEAMMSNARDEMQASIPTMIQAMQDMKPMVTAVIHEFTNYLSLVLEQAPSEAEQVISSAAHAIAPHKGEQIPAGHTEELNIFETIAEQFPHLHEAAGTDLGTPTGKVSFQVSASDKAKGYDASIGKIHFWKGKYYTAARLQQLIDATSSVSKASIKVEAKQGTPQLSIGEQLSGTKRKAGQSQKLAKAKFIQDIINIKGKIESIMRNAPKRFTPGAFPPFGDTNDLAVRKKQLVFVQQQLTNLLARYQF